MIRIPYDTLYQMYVVNLMSTEQMAIALHSDRETIRKKLHKFGIPVRRRGCIYAKGVLHNITETELRHLYIDEGKTQEQIANHFGCGSTLVSTLMQRYKIESRPRGDALRGKKKSVEHREKLARSLTNRARGEKNPKWKGGISTDYMRLRRIAQNNQWRGTVIRLRGEFCADCGKDLTAVCPCCGHRPDRHVHHIKSFADHPELRFDVANGIVLCETCHRLRHKNEATNS